MGDFCNQWLQFLIVFIGEIKHPHIPDIPRGKPPHARKFDSLNLQLYFEGGVKVSGGAEEIAALDGVTHDFLEKGVDK